MGLITALYRRWLLRQSFPDEWRPLVRERLPFTEGYSGAERLRFENHLKLFAWRVQFEGAGGLTVTDEMRVVVAGQAARIARMLPYGCYDHLGSVVLYPSHYQHEDKRADVVIFGEAHRLGTMVLSWDAVKHGLADPRDGHDTTVHELAHVLDAEDGEMDGTPLLERGYGRWASVLSRDFLALREGRRRRAVLREYGAVNEAEFFAVATEAFFEKPAQLKERKPDLYAELQRFFRVDPLARRG